MRKAADVQAQAPVKGGSEGVTELELRAAARELGIQDSAIDAALESEDTHRDTKAGFFGGPFQQSSELVFDGSIDDDSWEEVLADVRKTFGETGTVSRRGSTYEWTATGGGVDASTFTVRQTGGTIRVNQTSDLSGLGVLGYVASILPMILSIAFFAKVQLPVPWEPILALAWVALMLIGARGWSTGLAKKRAKAIDGLMRRVQSRLETEPTLRDQLARDATNVSETEAEPIAEAERSDA